HQRLDHGARNLVPQRGLVDALIEPHAGAVVFLFLVVLRGGRLGALHVDRHVFAEVGQRHHGLDRGVADQDEPYRLKALAALDGREQDAQLGTLPEAAVAAPAAEHAGDRLDLVRRRAEVAQDAGDVVAFLDRDGALVRAGAAARLWRGLGQ